MLAQINLRPRPVVTLDPALRMMQRWGVRVAMALTALWALLLVTIPDLVARAQTATPVPFTIDTNGLITQVNTWTVALDDIVFLGAAISIAIALLSFIAAQVLGAFKGARG